MHLDPKTRYAVRYGRSLQIALSELNDGGVNPAATNVVKELAEIGADETILAMLARERLGISVAEQTRWSMAGKALANWRDRIQDHGVYVFKAPLGRDGIDGFSLQDSEFPVIFLNSSDDRPKTRQLFTLCHELAHLIFHSSGITSEDESYVQSLTDRDRRLEEACNRLAGELLIPASDFDAQLRINSDTRDEHIGTLAKRYGVSREVVLRRMLDRHLVEQRDYDSRSARWREEARAFRVAREREKEEEKRRLKAEGKKPKGPTYFVTHASHLGNAYLKLVFERFYQGRLSSDQVADYLGTKAKSIAGLEEQFQKRGVA